VSDAVSLHIASASVMKYFSMTFLTIIADSLSAFIQK